MRRRQQRVFNEDLLSAEHIGMWIGVRADSVLPFILARCFPVRLGSDRFVFGEIGHEKFGNLLSANSTDSPTHLRAVAPTGIFAYDISEHVELNVAFSGIYWQASQAGSTNGRTVDSEAGMAAESAKLQCSRCLAPDYMGQPSLERSQTVTT